MRKAPEVENPDESRMRALYSHQGLRTLVTPSSTKAHKAKVYAYMEKVSFDFFEFRFKQNICVLGNGLKRDLSISVLFHFFDSCLS